ncbi:MAG: hypothetical protein JRJ00_17670 [Deltaproteobacteria bacterium]|nr:hypothetical protein [Deltaproteobacteria bacterium]
MSPELEDAFQEQRKRFVEKFEREPTSDDPIFFDPDADTPQPYPQEKFEESLVETMRKAGMDERCFMFWIWDVERSNIFM